MGGYLSSLICNIVSLPYPIYASFKAIESTEKDDDTKWLVYWVVYSILSVVESMTDLVVFWIPFYYELKLIFLLLLQIPQLGLAALLYQQYVRPFLIKNEEKIDNSVEQVKAKVTETAKSVARENINKFAQVGSEFTKAAFSPPPNKNE